ncbi:hypothetical protein EDD15DRAFT_1012382 [Pisolithus albus]|nr:hypothetical protein EDD15DRAFT_1012382 [Pisolithus albus]
MNPSKIPTTSFRHVLLCLPALFLTSTTSFHVVIPVRLFQMGCKDVLRRANAVSVVLNCLERPVVEHRGCTYHRPPTQPRA